MLGQVYDKRVVYFELSMQWLMVLVRNIAVIMNLKIAIITTGMSAISASMICTSSHRILLGNIHTGILLNNNDTW